MSDPRKTLPKRLTAFALGFLLLAIVLWRAPAMAGASEAALPETFTVSINVPLNEIQEGQWCVAYAVVHGGTPPYEYEWSGSYFWGSTQVVGAYMWGVDGYVELKVTDANENVEGDLVWLQVRPEYDYNPSCEAR